MILVLNLKMNLSKNNIIEYEHMIHEKNVIVLPQYPYLLFFNRGNYSLGSQDVSKFSKGSYTGEVCAKGLAALGVKYVLIGHSERKEYFNETIDDFRCKIKNTIDNNMIPIYCVNQNRNEYYNDFKLCGIEEQLSAIPDECKNIIIAYEPSYMIGNINGDEQLDIEHIKKVVYKIKEYLKEKNISNSIIYGGGVTDKNVETLNNLELDGYIVSSKALDKNDFENIYNKVNNK